MAEANWKDPELTPEEKTATLILARLNASPPVNVRRIAARFARIEEDAFTVACDAVTIRDPDGAESPKLILIRTRREPLGSGLTLGVKGLGVRS